MRRLAPFFEQQHFCSERQRVGGVVRGHHYLNAVSRYPCLQSLEEGIAGYAVKSGEWFIEKKQLRRGSQRPGQCYALRLSARQILRPALCQFCRTHERQHFFNAVHAPDPLHCIEPVTHVLRHSQVREERRLLRYQASLTLARSHGKPALIVIQHAPVQRYSHFGSHIEASQQPQQRAFASSRWAENYRPGCFEVAGDLQVKPAATRIDCEFKA